MAWSAQQYVKFEDERTRPAHDLLAQVPDLPEGMLYDLGCGPGNSTELIRTRFLDRPLTGIDSDADMLAAARRRLPDTPFATGDLATWEPDAPAALFYANAVFQWLPEHMALIDRLMDCLVPGGTLAVQMPDNLDEPTHLLMEDLTRDPRFASYYAGRSLRRKPLAAPGAFVDLLSRKATRIEVWHTIYNHPLADAEAIVDWVKGTGLRPYLDALPQDTHETYLEAYLDGVQQAYAPLADGRVLLRFPRIFVVAVKG